MIQMAENKESIQNEKPRIGVFVCHCGSNIGGFVDVPTVAEYAKTFPTWSMRMTTCTPVPRTASAHGEAVRKHNLSEPVIVASCPPRTPAPLFQATCIRGTQQVPVHIREHT